MDVLPELTPQIRFRAGQTTPAGRIPWLTRRQIQVGRHIAPPPPGSQSVVVAGAVRYGEAQQVMGWQKAPVLQYLSRGKGFHGGSAPLFGAADTHTFTEQIAADPHQFRLFISFPQEHPYFGYQAFAEVFMTRVEKDLHRPLAWLGAVHRDTAHTHVHIVLRGRDQQGQPLCILNDYLSHGLRYQASRLATWFFGSAQHD